jgi:hypothetical protein
LLYFVFQVPFGPNNSVLVAFGVEKVQVGGILLSRNDRVRAGDSTCPVRLFQRYHCF